MQCVYYCTCVCVCRSVRANYGLWFSKGKGGWKMQLRKYICEVNKENTRGGTEIESKENTFWGGAVGRRDGHQSFRFWQFGRERLSPPRRSGGRTRPLRMVLVTIESTSCGVTRPYQIPDPEGVYNCMSREKGVGKHLMPSTQPRGM